MSTINYEKIEVKVGETGILADSASVDISNELQSIYSLGYRGELFQTPTGPKNSEFRLNYFLDVGSDPSYNVVDIIRNLNKDSDYERVEVSVGNLSGNGYLSNYTLNASPTSPIKVSATYNVFNNVSGELAPKSNSITGDNTLVHFVGHGWGTVLKSPQGHIVQPTFNMIYEFNANWAPVYTIGSQEPAQVLLDNAQETLTFSNDIHTGITYSGEDPIGVLFTSGIIESFEGGIKGGSIIVHDPDFSDSVKITDIGVRCGNSANETMLVNLNSAKIVNENVISNIDDITRVQYTITKNY